jgi:hypothetical protein
VSGCFELKLRSEEKGLGAAARPAFFTPFFHGSPDTVAQKAAQLRDCDVGILDLAFVIPGAKRQGQAIKTFGEKVMPKLAKM